MDRVRILTMSAQSGRAEECFVAPLINEGAVIGVQLLVQFAVKMSGKSLTAARPSALERTSLVVQTE